MLLHVWSGFEGACSLDPECLALILLVQAQGLTSQIEIVADNNLLLGQLPLLETNSGSHTGFIEIVKVLSEASLLNVGSADTATQFYSEKLTSLSLWLLFETSNYEKLVRPAISEAVRFPMQYNLTIELQRAVKGRSESEGLHPKPTKKGGLTTPQVEAGVSKTHEKMLMETASRKKALNTTKKTSFAVAQAHPIYKHLETSLEDVEPNGPAYCLVAANVLLHSLSLPEPVLQNALKEYPKLGNLASWASAQSQSSRVRNDRDAYCLTSLVWAKVSTMVNSFWV